MSPCAGDGRRLIVEIVKCASALAVLEKASNLGYLVPYRLSEPPSGEPVMDSAQDSMAEVKFFDVS